MLFELRFKEAAEHQDLLLSGNHLWKLGLNSNLKSYFGSAKNSKVVEDEARAP